MRMSLPARGDAEDSTTLSSYFFEDGLRAGFDEQAGHVLAESDGLVGRRRSALLDVLRAVDGADASFENKLSTLSARPGAEGNLAATLQRGEERALGNDGGTGLSIVQSAEDVGGFVVGEAAFSGNGTLADRGHADIGGKRFADAVRPAETVESGFGEHHSVVFAALDFAKTGVNVAAQVADIEIGTDVAKLRLAAEASGADSRAVTEIGEGDAIGGDDAVAHVFAAKDGGKGNARGNVGGYVFDAMHGDVDGFFEKSVFQFLDENPFAANLRELCLGIFIKEL